MQDTWSLVPSHVVRLRCMDCKEAVPLTLTHAYSCKQREGQERPEARTCCDSEGAPTEAIFLSADSCLVGGAAVFERISHPSCNPSCELVN